MRIALRVDASARMGSGHARRCFALAQALTGLGAQVVIVSRHLDDASDLVLRDAPAPVQWLPAASMPPDASAASPPPDLPPEGRGVPEPTHAHWARVPWQQDADETIRALASNPCNWLVIDHYAFDARWHRRVGDALGTRIAAIDDIADRALAPELLVEPNLAPDHRAKYAAVLQTRARMLAGPRHALLAPAYRCAPRYAFHERVRSIGIFLGATDPAGANAQVLHACLALRGFDGDIEVVSSRANPALAHLRAQCDEAGARVRLSLDLPDLAAFFARHDLQVGAGGGSGWERCCIGAPTVAVEVADNQRPGLLELARHGVVVLAAWPGRAAAEGAQPLQAALQRACDDAALRRALADAGRALVDGRGAERVALAMLASQLVLRRARMDDAALLHAWRDHPATRATARDARPIAWPSHQAWMQAVLADPARHLLVGHVAGRPVGSLRWDLDGHGGAEVSLYLDPQLTGLGLGSALLDAGERHIERQAARMTGPLVARAFVRPDNRASAALFGRAGWTAQGGGRFEKSIATTS